MISDLPHHDAFGEDDLPVSELDDFLDRIGASALPLTGAVACLVDLPPEVVGPRAVRMAAPLEGPVAESLRNLVDNRPEALALHQRRGTVEAVVKGRRLCFLIERISSGRSSHTAFSLGTIVLGFNADEVSMAAAEKASRPFIAMLAALLVERRGKIAMAQDMAALGRQAAELQRRVQKDALSGLDNADAFRAQARETLGAGRGPYALVLMDLDNFKQINDLHGHQFGDVYLRAIAGALQGSVPPDSRLGRIGGDEFALLLRLPADAEVALLHVMRACSVASARLAETMGKSELGGISMGAAIPADLREQLQTRAIGQHQVEHQTGEVRARQRRARVAQRGHGVGGETGQAEADRESLGKHRVILDDQDAHETSLRGRARWSTLRLT